MAEAGPHLVKYGGNTTCFTLETEAGMIIIDAGTGMHHVNRELSGRETVPPVVILYTHFHLDHIIGLPIFGPLYRPDTDIVFMADPGRDCDWKEELRAFMRRPYWPVELKECASTRTFSPLPSDVSEVDVFGVKVSWNEIPHPQKSLAYRLKAEDQTVVVATDTEYETADEAGALIELSRDADYLLFDCQYLPEEFEKFRGYGHSTWQTGVEIAKRSNVKYLIMTHHAPGRTDAQVDAIVADAQQVFPHTVGARENMVLSLEGPMVREEPAPALGAKPPSR
ncbi:MAG: MBL fold metallo-hydrolase [Verrucomicrobiota bacterium]